jgi:hypothetical protein
MEADARALEILHGQQRSMGTRSAATERISGHAEYVLPDIGEADIGNARFGQPRFTSGLPMTAVPGVA